MKNISAQHKPLRLKEFDYSLPGFYFVTICSQNQKCWFGYYDEGKIHLNGIGIIAQKCWEEIPEHCAYADIDRYVIMPNHIHGIIILNDNQSTYVAHRHACANESISKDFNINGHFEKETGSFHIRPYQKLSIVVGSFKSAVSKLVHKYNLSSKFCWQKSFYDHIIRSEKELFEIRKYMENNPLKWNEDRFHVY
jgi:REP element-mobilizing transposase RayT